MKDRRPHLNSHLSKLDVKCQFRWKEHYSLESQIKSTIGWISCVRTNTQVNRINSDLDEKQYKYDEYKNGDGVIVITKKCGEN
jgi:hypothetical protein